MSPQIRLYAVPSNRTLSGVAWVQEPINAGQRAWSQPYVRVEPGTPGAVHDRLRRRWFVLEGL